MQPVGAGRVRRVRLVLQRVHTGRWHMRGVLRPSVRAGFTAASTEPAESAAATAAATAETAKLAKPAKPAKQAGIAALAASRLFAHKTA